MNVEGKLVNVYNVQLVKGPLEPRPGVSGKLGVFDYSGAGEGNVCLFAPDDPAALGGRVKLRPSPGIAQLEGDTLRFTVKDGSASYTWQLFNVITDSSEKQAFLDFAEANDRIIHHLLEGARLVEGQ